MIWPIVALFVLGLAVFAGSSVNDRWANGLLPSGVAGALVVVGIGLVAAALIWQPSRRPGLKLLRVVGLGLAVLLALAAEGRWSAIKWTRENGSRWPPRIDGSMASRVDSLSAAHRAIWATRLVAHSIATQPSSPNITIPVDWPFPADAMVAVATFDGGASIHVRTGPTGEACFSIPEAADSTCRLSRDLVHVAPVRAPRATAGALPARPAGDASWPEYRGDPAKSGVFAGAAGGGEWTAQIPGSIRASASIAGGSVLIGAHGTGAVGAFDLASGAVRWRSVVPNWVHQDLVTDGVVALVGFGNNGGSFRGRSPSGVTAWELSTGRHLWTAFDETSVMTSPVIVDSFLVYGSAGGMLRKRSLTTGALIKELRLPGWLVMAAPTLVGDTLIATLDPNTLCAIEVHRLEQLWCHEARGLRKLGHSSAAVRDGRIILAVPMPLAGASWADLRGLPTSRLMHLLRRALRSDANYMGQKIVAFSVHDGHELWRTRAFQYTRNVAGHTSGTPVLLADIGVVVAPVADSLVAFNPVDGAIRWVADAQRSRGAPLVVDSTVVVAGKDGRVALRSLKDGNALCETKYPAGFDRAGPALAGRTLVLADLDGGVRAVSMESAFSCIRPPTAISGP